MQRFWRMIKFISLALLLSKSLSAMNREFMTEGKAELSLLENLVTELITHVDGLSKRDELYCHKSEVIKFISAEKLTIEGYSFSVEKYFTVHHVQQLFASDTAWLLNDLSLWASQLLQLLRRQAGSYYVYQGPNAAIMYLDAEEYINRKQLCVQLEFLIKSLSTFFQKKKHEYVIAYPEAVFSSESV